MKTICKAFLIFLILTVFVSCDWGFTGKSDDVVRDLTLENSDDETETDEETTGEFETEIETDEETTGEFETEIETDEETTEELETEIETDEETTGELETEIETDEETTGEFETETETDEETTSESKEVTTEEPKSMPETYEVTLSAYIKEMYVGETYNLIVYVSEGANITSVIMKYDNNGSINIKNGVISALKEGEAKISVFAGQKKVSECDIIVKKSCKKIIENVEFICQYPQWPLGCELVSATMALRYADIKLTVDEFIEYVDLHAYPYINENGIRIGYDPNLYFAGNPKTYTAWGCFAKCIYNAINKIPEAEEYTVELLYDKSIDELCKTYIDNDIPVIFWATEGMAKPYAGRTWYIAENDEWFTWTNPEHCLLLVGYDDKYYYFNDPEMGSANKAYTRKSVEIAYEGLGKQAVVVYK